MKNLFFPVVALAVLISAAASATGSAAESARIVDNSNPSFSFGARAAVSSPPPVVPAATSGGGSPAVASPPAPCAANEPCATNAVVLPPGFSLEPLAAAAYPGNPTRSCSKFDFCYDPYASFTSGNFSGMWANIGTHIRHIGVMAFTVPTPGQIALKSDGTPLTFEQFVEGKGTGKVMKIIAGQRIEYGFNFDLVAGGDIYGSVGGGMVTISKLPGDMGFSGNIPELCSNHMYDRVMGVSSGESGGDLIKNHPMEGWWLAAGPRLSSDGEERLNGGKACWVRPGQTYYINMMFPNLTTDPTKSGVLGYAYVAPDNGGVFQKAAERERDPRQLFGFVSIFYDWSGDAGAYRGVDNSYSIDPAGNLFYLSGSPYAGPPFP